MNVVEPVPRPVVLVLMGVSGCGKTSVAAILAACLGWPYKEGDSLHPQSNIDKMKAGHPLTDQDRAPWLEKVAQWIGERLDAGEDAVVTCSALKVSYRRVLDRRGSGVRFVYLAGSKALIASRLVSRHGHFMPPALLDSQFADLEEPSLDEPAIRVDVNASPSVIAGNIMKKLGIAHASN